MNREPFKAINLKPGDLIKWSMEYCDRNDEHYAELWFILENQHAQSLIFCTCVYTSEGPISQGGRKTKTEFSYRFFSDHRNNWSLIK